jgi:hypothetical protein
MLLVVGHDMKTVDESRCSDKDVAVADQRPARLEVCVNLGCFPDDVIERSGE